MSSSILILGGGTFYHVRNHLSIAAPAFGTTARWLHEQLPGSRLVLTRMADSSSSLETNADVERFLTEYLTNNQVKCVVMNVAMCDYDGEIDGMPSGKHAVRLQSKTGRQTLQLTASKKVIADIKTRHPDVFLTGFKTTTHHSEEEQWEAAVTMGQKSRCNLIFANDTVTRHNMLVDEEGRRLCAGADRLLVLKRLVQEIKIQDSAWNAMNSLSGA